MITINVKPVPELEIKLKDKKYRCTFNMICMAHMQEVLTTLAEENETLADVSPAHMCAFILYAGIKANDDSFTLEEAKALAVNMGPGSYGEVIGMFNEAVCDSLSTEDNRQLKKMLAQRTAKILNQ